MAIRVPKAELPTELRETMIRQLGVVPEPVEVLYNNPKLADANQQFEDVPVVVELRGDGP